MKSIAATRRGLFLKLLSLWNCHRNLHLFRCTIFFHSCEISFDDLRLRHVLQARRVDKTSHVHPLVNGICINNIVIGRSLCSTLVRLCYLRGMTYLALATCWMVSKKRTSKTYTERVKKKIRTYRQLSDMYILYI